MEIQKIRQITEMENKTTEAFVALIAINWKGRLLKPLAGRIGATGHA